MQYTIKPTHTHTHTHHMFGNKPLQYYTTHIECGHPMQPHIEYALAAAHLPKSCSHITQAGASLEAHSAGYGETDLILFNTLCSLFLLCLILIERRLELSRSQSDKIEQKQTGSEKDSHSLTF